MTLFFFVPLQNVTRKQCLIEGRVISGHEEVQQCHSQHYLSLNNDSEGKKKVHHVMKCDCLITGEKKSFSNGCYYLQETRKKNCGLLVGRWGKLVESMSDCTAKASKTNGAITLKHLSHTFKQFKKKS